MTRIIPDIFLAPRGAGSGLAFLPMRGDETPPGSSKTEQAPPFIRNTPGTQLASEAAMMQSARERANVDEINRQIRQLKEGIQMMPSTSSTREAMKVDMDKVPLLPKVGRVAAGAAMASQSIEIIQKWISYFQDLDPAVGKLAKAYHDALVKALEAVAKNPDELTLELSYEFRRLRDTLEQEVYVGRRGLATAAKVAEENKAVLQSLVTQSDIVPQVVRKDDYATRRELAEKKLKYIEEMKPRVAQAHKDIIWAAYSTGEERLIRKLLEETYPELFKKLEKDAKEEIRKVEEALDKAIEGAWTEKARMSREQEEQRRQYEEKKRKAEQKKQEKIDSQKELVGVYRELWLNSQKAYEDAVRRRGEDWRRRVDEARRRHQRYLDAVGLLSGLQQGYYDSEFYTGE